MGRAITRHLLCKNRFVAFKRAKDSLRLAVQNYGAPLLCQPLTRQRRRFKIADGFDLPSAILPKKTFAKT
ncbi:MAG: hypothetical protein THHGLFOP_000081 [Candidatus Fervidibacter sp.]